MIGLVNVQLALVDGEISVLEANPRASRTVPFASKATGVNLVEAACRLMAGAPLASLALPQRRRGGDVSVKAAVLPFARFPGSDPVLGPEMRSTGEVMATADDFPSAFGKAERAAGRPLPQSGTVFVSVRDADKRAIVPVAATLAGLGFRLVATAGTGAALTSSSVDVEMAAKVSEAAGGDATVVDLIRRERCDLVINTPQESGAARSDGYLIRESACCPRSVRDDGRRCCCVRPGHRPRPYRKRPQPPGAACRGASGLASRRARASGRTRCYAWSAATWIPGGRASSSCWRRRDACCRDR